MHQATFPTLDPGSTKRRLVQGDRTVMSYTVITDLCTADEHCAAVCPVDCITFPASIEGRAVIDQDECIDCAACVDECPVEAIVAS